MIIVIELLLCMSQMFNISYWWYDTIEKYLIKLNNEFDQHLSIILIIAITIVIVTHF